MWQRKFSKNKHFLEKDILTTHILDDEDDHDERTALIAHKGCFGMPILYTYEGLITSMQ